jgi:hypothetical protein
MDPNDFEAGATAETGEALICNGSRDFGPGWFAEPLSGDQPACVEWRFTPDELASLADSPFEQSVRSDDAIRVRLWRDDEGRTCLRIGRWT